MPLVKERRIYRSSKSSLAVTLPSGWVQGTRAEGGGQGSRSGPDLGRGGWERGVGAVMSAAGVAESTAPNLGAGPGSTPRAALQSIEVRPIPVVVAKKLLEREHYLHSLPGGTRLAFGAFLDQRLMGALTLGAGPSQAFRLVEGASADDCAVLSRLWLSDELPCNSESRVLGIVLRSLRRHTNLKFVVTYADPAEGHVGTVYQATGWCYIGLSSAMPLYDLGDGVARHSRSVAHAYGTHSVKHFSSRGVDLRLVPQSRKHCYVYVLDPAWRSRLRRSLPYPKRRCACM